MAEVEVPCASLQIGLGGQKKRCGNFFPFSFVHCPLHTFRYKLPFYTSKKEKNGNELRRSMLKNQTPSYIPQQGYLINTLKPKREKIIWNLGTCVLSLLMGAGLLLINLEKVAEKTKWEVRIGGQVSEMQLTAGKDKMRGKMVATDWCWAGSLRDVKGSRLNEGTLVNQSFSFWS